MSTLVSPPSVVFSITPPRPSAEIAIPPSSFLKRSPIMSKIKLKRGLLFPSAPDILLEDPRFIWKPPGVVAMTESSEQTPSCNGYVAAEAGIATSSHTSQSVWSTPSKDLLSLSEKLGAVPHRRVFALRGLEVCDLRAKAAIKYSTTMGARDESYMSITDVEGETGALVTMFDDTKASCLPTYASTRQPKNCEPIKTSSTDKTNQHSNASSLVHRRSQRPSDAKSRAGNKSH